MGNCCSNEVPNDMSLTKQKTGKKIKKTRKSANAKGAEGKPEDAQVISEVSTSTGADLEKMKELWEDPFYFNDDGIRDENFFEEEEITLDRRGDVHPLFNQEVTDKIFEHINEDVKKTYEREGPYMYRKGELNECKFKHESLEVRPLTKCDDGSIYLGQWNKETNKREGRGVAILADGSLYEGFWHDDLKSGHGRLIFSSGDAYQGQWRHGVSCHYGVFVGFANYKVKGNWKYGKIHGQTYECLANGSTYKGDFEDGKKHGKGVFIFGPGHHYEGEMRENKK
mmetsp:Transcript_17334/g.20097  ORF Transcript_17334/g.20097 Transcript_17334/m.20097 type:complete len:282 (+) Transcript_17334:42-887(+)